MPELPEVEVVRAGLEPAVTGATVVAVTVHDARAITRHNGDADEFTDALTGRRMSPPARRGKFLWVPLDLDEPGAATSALLVHLGMSGQLLLRPAGAPPERHERVRLDIEHSAHGELSVVFADQRTFGSLAVDSLRPSGDDAGNDTTAVPSQVAHIARDPLDPVFDEAAFLTGLRRTRSGIKRVLLDQRRISGVGNIYADEALWAAGIHPETAADRISAAAASRLLEQLRVVLHKALAEGGTSFDTQYVNVNGQAGYFAHSLNAYGRGGQPCPRCGTPIVREKFMNRSSHSCPMCQRPPSRSRDGSNHLP